MPRQNVVFAIVAPVVLLVIIAIIVVCVGETLLTVHHLANESFHVGAYASEEQNKAAEELAALYPVAVAMAIATVFLIGGAIASRLAPQPKH